MNRLRRELNDFARSCESLSEPREDREVGVKLDARKAAHAERREAVVVLQAELALNGATLPVQVAEPLSVPRDARVLAAYRPHRENDLLCLRAFERDYRGAAARLALRVDAPAS
jgi:hypothetical protein